MDIGNQSFRMRQSLQSAISGEHSNGAPFGRFCISTRLYSPTW